MDAPNFNVAADASASERDLGDLIFSQVNH